MLIGSSSPFYSVLFDGFGGGALIVIGGAAVRYSQERRRKRADRSVAEAGDVETLKTQFATFQKWWTGVPEDPNNPFQAFQPGFRQRFETLETRVASVDGKVASVDGKVDALSTQVGEIKSLIQNGHDD